MRRFDLVSPDTLSQSVMAGMVWLFGNIDCDCARRPAPWFRSSVLDKKIP